MIERPPEQWGPRMHWTADLKSAKESLRLIRASVLL